MDVEALDRPLDEPAVDLGLAPLPLGLLVEARVLDGDRRLAREEADELLFLPRETGTPAEEDDEHPQGPLLGDERARRARVQVGDLKELALQPARVTLDVPDELGPARHEDRPGDAFAVGGLEAGEEPRVLRRQTEAAARAEHATRGVVHEDPGHPRLEEPGRGLGDAAEGVLAGGRRRDEVRERREAGEPLAARPSAAVAGGLLRGPRRRRAPTQCRTPGGRARRGARARPPPASPRARR
jgi:hypothetical protein